MDIIALMVVDDMGELGYISIPINIEKLPEHTTECITSICSQLNNMVEDRVIYVDMFGYIDEDLNEVIWEDTYVVS